MDDDSIQPSGIGSPTPQPESERNTAPKVETDPAVPQDTGQADYGSPTHPAAHATDTGIGKPERPTEERDRSL